jgi:hypothetical protein
MKSVPYAKSLRLWLPFNLNFMQDHFNREDCHPLRLLLRLQTIFPHMRHEIADDRASGGIGCLRDSIIMTRSFFESPDENGNKAHFRRCQIVTQRLDFTLTPPAITGWLVPQAMRGQATVRSFTESQRADVSRLSRSILLPLTACFCRHFLDVLAGFLQRRPRFGLSCRKFENRCLQFGNGGRRFGIPGHQSRNVRKSIFIQLTNLKRHKQKL